MKNTINIAVVGLGQIGNYLLNELIEKRKDINLKTGKINTINIVRYVFGKDTTTTKFRRTYEINTHKYFKC